MILRWQTRKSTVCADIITQITDDKHLADIDAFSQNETELSDKHIKETFHWLTFNPWLARRWVIQKLALSSAAFVLFSTARIWSQHCSKSTG